MTGKHFGVFILALSVVTTALWVQLNQDTYLRGPDAYYYALQADYWATTGKVKIPDSSIIHRINGQMQRFWLETETAIRTWIVISIFLLVGITIYLFKSKNLLISALTICWLILSPSLLFVAIEFPKLFAFLIIVPVFLYFLRRPPPTNLYTCIPLGLALFIHKAAIPIVGLLVGLLLLENHKFLFRSQRNLLIAMGVSGLFIAVYLLMGDHFHLLDLSRLGGWDNISPGILTLLSRDALPVAIKIELLLACACFIAVLVWYLKTQQVRVWAVAYCFGLLLPGFFPFSANEVFGVGERYAILLPFFLLLASLFLISHSKWTISGGAIPAFVGIACAVAISITWRLSYSHPDYLEPDNRTYDKITTFIRNNDIPMLIVHRGFNFYYKYRTHKESFHYEPEKHWDKSKIWRLTYRITPDEFDYYLKPPCSWDGGLVRNVGDNDYFLIREDCWVKFRSSISEENDQDLYTRVWQWWRNPATLRPAFLYRKHKTVVDDVDEIFPTFKKQ